MILINLSCAAVPVVDQRRATKLLRRLLHKCSDNFRATAVEGLPLGTRCIIKPVWEFCSPDEGKIFCCCRENCCVLTFAYPYPLVVCGVFGLGSLPRNLGLKLIDLPFVLETFCYCIYTCVSGNLLLHQHCEIMVAFRLINSAKPILCEETHARMRRKVTEDRQRDSMMVA